MVVTNLDTYRTRYRPQHLQAVTADTRSPLVSAIDDIAARSLRPKLRVINDEPRDPMKWRKRRNLFLWQQYMEARKWRARNKETA